MKLTDAMLSFPTIKYQTKVTHFSSRVSNPIEWIILESINKISDNPQCKKEYKEYNIDYLFSEIFPIGIPGDSEKLIKPCLINLIDIDAISCKVPLDDNTDLTKYLIDNLTLTDSGRKMHEKEFLPGENIEDSIEILFDLLTKEIKLDTNYSKLSKEKYGISVIDTEENLDKTPLPATAIKDFLVKLQRQEKSPLPWLSPTVEIRDIVLDNSNEPSASILWTNKRYNISCSNDMIISIENLPNNEIVKNVLPKLELNTSNNLILTNNVSNISINNADSELSRILTIEQLEKTISNSINEDRFIFIDKQLINIDIENILNEKETKICLIFDNDDFSIKQDKNLIIKLPKTDIINKNIVYGNEKFNLYLGNFKLKIDNFIRETCLCYEPKTQKENFDKIIEKVFDKFYNEKHYELIFLLLYIGKEKQFTDTLNSILLNKKTFKEKLVFIDKIYEQIKQLSLSYNVSKEDFYLNQIVLDGNTKDKIKKTTEIIEEIKSNAILKKDSKLVKNICEKILTSLSTYSTVDNVYEILDKIRTILDTLKNTNGLTLIQKSGYIKKIYNDDILLDLLKKYEDNDLVNITLYTKLEEILVGLKRNLSDIKILLKMDSKFEILNKLHLRENITELTKDSLNKIISKNNIDVAKLNVYVKKHRELIKSLDNYLENRKKTEFQDSVFSKIEDLLSMDIFFVKCEKSIEIISDFVMNIYNESALKYNKIYVIDTCAIMNEPNLVDKFVGNKSALIIPKKVIEELNRNKDFINDPEKSEKAKNANKKLRVYLEKNVPWLFAEESHPDLLPIDYPAKLNSGNKEKDESDNLILSVAIKYKTNNVVFITDDTNLKLKSMFEKIKHQSSKEFIGGNKK